MEMMMSSRHTGFASKTKVPVERTKMEIDALLAKHGATSRGIAVNDTDGTASIGFVRGGLKYRLAVPLPKAEAVRKGDKPPGWPKWTDERKADWTRAEWEQRCRTRWRSMLLLLKAKFEAVAMHVSSVEKEFMADLVLPDGQTVEASLGAAIHEALGSGKMPTLLLPEARS